jgi:transcriptional regulator with XRE-family HTH domain
VTFDQRSFFEAVDRRRVDLNLSWRQIAASLSLSPSTFTRLAQGRRPDVDTFVKLLAWLDRPAEDFVKKDPNTLDAAAPVSKDTVRKIADSLRSDPNLSSQNANALEDIVRVAYHRLRDA